LPQRCYVKALVIVAGSRCGFTWGDGGVELPQAAVGDNCAGPVGLPGKAHVGCPAAVE